MNGWISQTGRRGRSDDINIFRDAGPDRMES